MEVQDVPGDLRRRARARHRHPARQYLGDAPALPGDRRRRRHHRSSPHQICRRPCRRDARRGDRDRANISSDCRRPTWDLGHAVSPDDAWLGSRGLRTMAVRLKQHEDERAQDRAIGSRSSREVGLVLHPALPDCPGHELWKRDFKGSSGLFSFELKAARHAAAPSSTGSSCSASATAGAATRAWRCRSTRSAPSPKPPASNLVRLHIGLEDPDDLIADLAAALKASR